MDTTVFAEITGRYKNGNDGLATIYNEGNRLFLKFIRGESTELFMVGENLYTRRENGVPIQFKVNPADGKLNLVFVPHNDNPMEYKNPKMGEDEKIPYEYLITEEFDQALAGYQNLMKVDPNDAAIEESRLNNQGYTVMNSGNVKLAKNIFKVAIMLYPASSNLYDSYAEACMKNGDLEEAIVNYRKSLELDPKNTNAVEKLKELQKGKAVL